MSDIIRDPAGGSGGSGGSEPVSFRSLASVSIPAPAPYAGPDWYRMAEEALGLLATSCQKGNPFKLDGVARVSMMEVFTKIATGIVDALRQSDHFLTKVSGGKKGSPVVSNMVNVSILATKLGMGIGYQREALIGLALAGLLHDVGMFLLPESLLSNPGKLNEDERALIRRHTETGSQMLGALGPQYAWLAQVVAQEHERWDGKGYPNGLTGEQIHEYARIIGLVDIFEALMNPRPYRRRLMPHEAIREVLIAEKTAFPNQIIKALVEQFSLFPLGTMVQLNTGEVGVVTQLNPRYPLRPVVSVNQGTAGAGSASAKSVDLSATTLVHIVEVIEADRGE